MSEEITSPPEILWHYTSFKALISIVEERKIRATEIHYLNDSSEFNHGCEVTLKAAELKFGRDSEILDSARFIISHFLPEALNVFVFSLSEREDLLSQWRSYCPLGGCAIGFAYEDLCIQFTRSNERPNSSDEFRRCIYDETEQMKIADSLWVESLKLGYTFDHPSPVDLFVRVLWRGVPFFKNPTFEEEEEWRLVLSQWRVLAGEVTTPGYRPIKYRDGASMIIPYVEVPLEALSIKRVMIGPSPHPELSRASVESLLNTTQSDIKVEVSKIPYRSW